MKFFKSTFLIAALMGPTFSSAGNKLPDFADNPIPGAQVFNVSPEPVDLSSYPGAKTYRTKLQDGASHGPNFAGHYTVVSIGCGTQCQENWIIDAQTGKILYKFHSVIGIRFQPDSALMIVNPPDKQFKQAYEAHPDQPLLGEIDTIYEVWKNNKFNVVLKDKWVNIIQSSP